MNQIKDFFDYILNAIKIWIIVQPWEMGLRVRTGKNIKVLKGGIYFRIPYLDSIYIQSVRLRVISLPMQTVTSKDGQTVTVTGCVGYEISDIETLYTKMYHPELTISNIVMSCLADYVYTHNISSARPTDIENEVIKALNTDSYGVKINYFKLTGFAIVKTIRLIQDQSWVSEGMRLDVKQ